MLQTQKYMQLCEKLPTGRYIHHSANDCPSFFDPLVGERSGLEQDVRMLALYVASSVKRSRNCIGVQMGIVVSG